MTCQANITLQPIQESRHSPGLLRVVRRTRLDPPEARKVDRRRWGWFARRYDWNPRRPASNRRVDRASGLAGSRLRGAVDPDAARSRVDLLEQAAPLVRHTRGGRRRSARAERFPSGGDVSSSITWKRTPDPSAARAKALKGRGRGEAAALAIQSKVRIYEGRRRDRIRTGVRGFAGLCLTSRPPRRRVCHRTGPRESHLAGNGLRAQNGRTPHLANLVPGLMAHGVAGAPAPYRGSAMATRKR